MCRSIKRLREGDEVGGEDQIREAALQYVRKVSGFRAARQAQRGGVRLRRRRGRRGLAPAARGRDATPLGRLARWAYPLDPSPEQMRAMGEAALGLHRRLRVRSGDGAGLEVRRRGGDRPRPPRGTARARRGVRAAARADRRDRRRTRPNNAGPGFLAYIPGGGLFASSLADLLSTTIDRFVNLWGEAPVAAQIEDERGPLALRPVRVRRRGRAASSRAAARWRTSRRSSARARTACPRTSSRARCT